MTEMTTKRICDVCKDPIPKDAAHVSGVGYATPSESGACRGDLFDVCVTCWNNMIGAVLVLPALDAS